jgi:hypothetical protein
MDDAFIFHRWYEDADGNCFEVHKGHDVTERGYVSGRSTGTSRMHDLPYAPLNILQQKPHISLITS